MIRLRADVAVSLVVDPSNWDSEGGLQVSVENAVRRALGGLGQVPVIDVKVSLLNEIDAQTLGVT